MAIISLECISSNNKYLVVDHPYVNETILTLTLSKYLTLRDYHHRPYLFSPVVNTVALIAYGINASIISKEDRKLDLISCSERTILFVYAGSSLDVVIKIWNIFQNSSERVKVVQQNPVAYNFAYCDTLEEETHGFNVLEIFLSSADYFVWISLTLSIVAVTFLDNVFVGIDGFQISTVPRKMISTISVLVSTGFSGVKKNSILFTMWMYACLIFGTYYSGSLTSIVIKPSPVKGFSTIEEVAQNNYTLIYESAARLGFANRSAHAKRYHVASDLDNDPILNMFNAAKIISAKANFIQMIATEHNMASATDSYSTISLAVRAQDYLDQRKVSDRKCFIGKKLAFHKSTYYMFTPPKNKKPWVVFQLLFEAGFYQRWAKEYMGIAVAGRVQDRSKVVSQTILTVDKEVATPLNLNGKLRNIFLLWSIFLLLSTLSATCEYVLKSTMLFRK